MEIETKWTKPEVDSLIAILNKKLLLNDDVLPVTLREIFWLNKFKFENYERIKYFANKYPEEEILATLASYQNKADLPLLHQNYDKAYLAISQFPDKSFIPELKQRIDKTLYDWEYLKAVAGFKTDDAEELLMMVVAQFEAAKDDKKHLDMFDGEKFDYFYKHLENNGSAFTDDFLIKLWMNNRKISYSFFIKIKDRHYNEILQGYLNPIPFDSATMSDTFDWKKYKAEYEAADGYLCPIILKYLKKNSSITKEESVKLDAIECKG